ncbi:hypothetical protein H4R18_001656 [Coemansia javaensis]|uniref:Uncharacterized protein n=1 Tax=Coemansia javaensis TaxID=2761396 RepID=A0A9W8HGJ9_9FUNG|nr:hypothetical protein H4R18_001656 [Coemansia javaensis]
MVLKVAAQSGFNICGDGMVLIPDGATAEPAPSIKLSALRGMRFRLCPKPGAKYVEVYNARGARAEFCCYGMSFLDLRRDAARLHGVKGEVFLAKKGEISNNNNTVAVYMAHNGREFSFPAAGTVRDLKVTAQTSFRIYGDGMMLVPDGAAAEPAASANLSTFRGTRFRLCPRPGARYIEVYNERNARAEFCCYGMSFLDLRRDAARMYGIRGDVVLRELVTMGRPGARVANHNARVTAGRVSSYVVMSGR